MAVFRMNDCYRHFSQALIGRPEDAYFGNLGACIEFSLHLCGGNVLAAADDDFFLAIDDEKIAGIVEIADAASDCPALAKARAYLAAN